METLTATPETTATPAPVAAAPAAPVKPAAKPKTKTPAPKAVKPATKPKAPAKPLKLPASVPAVSPAAAAVKGPRKRGGVKKNGTRPKGEAHAAKLPPKPNSKYQPKPAVPFVKPPPPPAEEAAAQAAAKRQAITRGVIVPTVPKMIQNGITRPADTWGDGRPKVTAQVWQIADKLAAETKRIPTRKEMLNAIGDLNPTLPDELKITHSVFANQFYRWRHFNGVQGHRRLDGVITKCSGGVKPKKVLPFPVATIAPKP